MIRKMITASRSPRIFCDHFRTCLHLVKMLKITFLVTWAMVWMLKTIPVFKQLANKFPSPMTCNNINCLTWLDRMANLFAQLCWCKFASWQCNTDNIDWLMMITWQIEFDFLYSKDWGLFSFISSLSISSLQVTMMSFFIPLSFFTSKVIVERMKTINVATKIGACLAIFHFKFWYQVGTFWFFVRAFF